MDFELTTLTLEQAAATDAQALILLLADGFEPANDPASKLAGAALASGDFKTEPGALLATYAPAGFSAKRVVLAGVGSGGAPRVRKAVAQAVAALRGSPATAVTLVFARQPDAPALQAAVLALGDAGYAYTTTKNTLKGPRAGRVDAAVKPPSPRVARATIGVPDAAVLRTDFEVAEAVAQGVEFAREWANRPANHATPTLLGDAAAELACTHGFECEVMGPSEVARLGMGAFQAVAQGSREPLRFIALRWRGANSPAPIVLVGKGITFDTGGISLKPAAEMDEMKFDMSGAASVLGVFRALGALRPPVDVVGLIPACENMPDGGALKPGDVITSMAGHTIEVLNTDAEGRLVLCDALTYAERYEPRAVIDIATLTGACVIALGGVRSGLFSSDDQLASALQAAGDASLDPCWRLPLDDEYADALKSNFADIANVGGRPAGAVTAAKFLQRFAARFPWAHLDIAGTAWRGGAAKGASGRPVGLLVHYLLGLVDAVPVSSGGQQVDDAASPAPGKPRKSGNPRRD